MDAFAYAEAYSDALADALATALADASADAHSIVYCHFWHGINDAPPQSLQLVASPDPLRLLKADKVLATELLLDAVKEHPRGYRAKYACRMDRERRRTTLVSKKDPPAYFVTGSGKSRILK